jgi:hypothetical protein
MAKYVTTGANSSAKKWPRMNMLKVSDRREVEELHPKGFRYEARKADTDAEFRQGMLLLHREMRSDGNDADEMRETVASVVFFGRWPAAHHAIRAVREKARTGNSRVAREIPGQYACPCPALARIQRHETAGILLRTRCGTHTPGQERFSAPRVSRESH